MVYTTTPVISETLNISTRYLRIIPECYPFRRLAGKCNSISEDLMNMNNIRGW